MKHVIFSVRDSAAAAYANPFTFATTPMAIRAFTGEVNNVDSMMNKHPGDYELWVVGHFDPDTGSVEYVSPYMVARASDVLGT